MLGTTVAAETWTSSVLRTPFLRRFEPVARAVHLIDCVAASRLTWTSWQTQHPSDRYTLASQENSRDSFRKGSLGSFLS